MYGEFVGRGGGCGTFGGGDIIPAYRADMTSAMGAGGPIVDEDEDTI